MQSSGLAKNGARRGLLGFSAVLLIGLAAGLPAKANITIVPFYQSSITSLSGAASIEATINSAIAFYEATISNNITVGISFGNMTGGLGESITYEATDSYTDFHSRLIADSSGDATDTTALAGLPAADPFGAGGSITAKVADFQALGVSFGFLADPCGGSPNTTDGCILVNTSLTTPPGAPGPSEYSLLAVVEHEIDEVLGLGSGLGCSSTGCSAGIPNAEDLFRYTAAGARSYALNTQITESCAGASTAFFSLNGTTDLAQFNNCNNGGDYGDWQSPSSPPQVQDAFGSPGSSPSLTRTSPEIVALDAIGYNLTAVAPTPEPTSVLLLGSAALIAGIFAKRRLVK